MGKIEALRSELMTMNNLQDMTNVLEQVAARDIALMREQILKSRPYFQEVWRVNQILQQLTPPAPKVVHKHLVVAVALDWGMPGELLAKVLKKSAEIYETHGTDLLIAGNMGHTRFEGDTSRTIHYFSLPRKIQLAQIEPIYDVIATYARVTYVFPRFESLSKQIVAVASNDFEKRDEKAGQAKKSSDVKIEQFIVEPDPQAISDYMNRAITGLTVYHYFNEAALAYSASQMIAMRNAFTNAKNETKILKNKYFKAQRERIDAKLREMYGAKLADLELDK